VCVQGTCFGYLRAVDHETYESAGFERHIASGSSLTPQGLFAPQHLAYISPHMLLQVRHILYRIDTGRMNFLMHSAAGFEAKPTGEVPPSARLCSKCRANIPRGLQGTAMGGARLIEIKIFAARHSSATAPHIFTEVVRFTSLLWRVVCGTPAFQNACAGPQSRQHAPLDIPPHAAFFPILRGGGRESGRRRRKPSEPGPPAKRSSGRTSRRAGARRIAACERLGPRAGRRRRRARRPRRAVVQRRDGSRNAVPLEERGGYRVRAILLHNRTKDTVAVQDRTEMRKMTEMRKNKAREGEGREREKIKHHPRLPGERCGT